MKVEHTPGPWHVGTDGNVYTGITEGRLVATVSHVTNGVFEESSKPGNSRRIVATINACQGFPTEALEAGVVKELVDALTDIRATLMKKADSRYTPTLGDLVHMLDKADAALAKAKGENAPPIEGR
jgi:hypothetical protein